MLAPAGVEAILYDGLAAPPAFNPDQDNAAVPAAASELRAQIRGADGLLFSIPEYAGALPGALKNLLDWTIGDAVPCSIYQKPVAWINVSPRGAANAHQQLHEVLGYAHATVIEAACAHMPVTGAQVGDDGLVTDPAGRDRIAQALAALTAHLAGSSAH